MSHSETCRKRFDSIEKKKLDKQLEEAKKESELPQVNTVEMDVEQPQEQPCRTDDIWSGGGAGGKSQFS